MDYILSLMALVPFAAGVLFDGTGGGDGDSDGDDAL